MALPVILLQRGEQSVELFLTHTTAGVVDIDVNDGTFTDLDGDPTEDPNLNFVDSVLRFDSIGTQIASKNSDISPGAQMPFTLRAIETDMDTGACVAALQGMQTVRLAYECLEPGTCATGEVLNLAGENIDANDSGAVADYTDVDLTFNTAGEVSVGALNYNDVGRIRLHAEVDVPASLPDPAITIVGASNEFVVRPAGVCVQALDIDNDCASQDANCSDFVAAGADFNLQISARDWQSDTDTDFCNGNQITPNYQMTNLALISDLLAPSGTGAVDGSLSVVAASISAGGEVTVNDQSYSEVGVINITVAEHSYLGETISASTSAPIGRFIPGRFVLVGTPSITEACTSGGTGFTYMGQPFVIQFSLEARRVSNMTPEPVTQNYAGAFAKLDSYDELNIDARAASAIFSSNRISESTVTSLSFNWAGGTGAVSGGLVFDRISSPDGPFNTGGDALQIGFAPVDEDDVALSSFDLDISNDGNNDHGLLTDQASQRYGRLRVENAFGPEERDLPIELQAEFFNGTNFVFNADDACTTYNNTAAGILTDPGNTGSIAPANTMVLPVDTTLSGGLGALILQAPVPALTGSVNIELDMSAMGLNQPWLQFDWRDPSGVDDNPQSTATFGRYRGHDRIILWQELN